MANRLQIAARAFIDNLPDTAIGAAVKAFVTAPPRSKSYTGGYWTGAGGYGRNNNLMVDKTGAAVAAAVIPYIYAIVNTVTDTVSGIPYHVRDNKRDNIYTLDDPRGEPVMEALQAWSRRNNGASIFEPYIAHYSITGEAYLELTNNTFDKPRGIELIHPLLINPVSYDGYSVDYFQLFGNDPRTIDPRFVSFDRMDMNLLDFGLRGHSPVMALIGGNVIDTLRNAGQAIQGHFRHNGLPYAIVSPDPQPGFEPDWGDETINRVRDLIAQNKGASQSYGINVLPRALRVATFDPPDLQKWATLINDQKGEIFGAFSIAPSVVGITFDTKYQVSEQDEPRYKRMMASRLQAIERIINTRVIPFFYGGENPVTFEFDLSSLITVDPQNVTLAQQLYRDGVIPESKYLEMVGIPDHDEEEDYFYVNGVPIPLSEKPNYWRHSLLIAPSVYNAPEVTGKPLPQPENPNAVIPTDEGEAEPIIEESEKPDGADEAPEPPLPSMGGGKADTPAHYIMLRVGNHPSIRQYQNTLKELHDGKGTFEPPDDFHVTLAYGTSGKTELDYTEIAKAARDISLIVDDVSNFDDKGDGIPVFLTLKKTPELMALQKAVADSLRKQDVELSPYNDKPDDYKPHITLGYVDSDLRPVLKESFTVNPLALECFYDDKRVKIFECGKAVQASVTDEYQTWRKFAMKHGHEKALRFETFHLPSRVTNDIRVKLASGASIEDTFKAERDIETEALQEDGFMELMNIWAELGMDDLVTEVEREADASTED